MLKHTGFGSIVGIYISACCNSKIGSYFFCCISCFYKTEVQVKLIMPVMAVNKTRPVAIGRFIEIVLVINFCITGNGKGLLLRAVLPGSNISNDIA